LFGADNVVNIKSKSKDQVRKETDDLTRGKGIDVLLDIVRLEQTVQTDLRIVAKGGALVIVGLFGNKISIPAFAAVANEFQFYGSFWANYNEVSEVIELAKRAQIKHRILKFKFGEINEAVISLEQELIVG
jgi:alcohol dehydrogenase, propanol-preferring